MKKAKLLLLAGLVMRGLFADVSDEPLRWAKGGEEADLLAQLLRRPGAEAAAVEVVASDPDRLLPVLRGIEGEGVLEPMRHLVEAEIRLRQGDREAALDGFRSAAEGYRRGEGGGFYPVEPPRGGWGVPLPLVEGRLSTFEPFAFGPGSHQDHWLIRRFLALEAWDDALGEYRHVHARHKQRAEPFVRRERVYRDNQEFETVLRRYEPGGLDGPALDFLVDYGFFLRRHERADEALALILEGLEGLDLDRNPNHPRGTPVEAPADEEPSALEFRPARAFHSFRTYGGMSRQEFLRLGYGLFKEMGQEARLEAAIESRIADGHPPARRVLARVRSMQQRREDALALELEYLDQGGFTDLTRLIRRGLVFDQFQRHAEAIGAFEAALAFPPGEIPSFPDADEADTERMSMSSMPAPLHLARFETSRAHWRADLLERLIRLYAAMGQSNEVLAASLRRLDSEPKVWNDFRSLGQIGDRFAAAGREAEFQAALRERAATTEDADERATLFWTAGDMDDAMAAVVAAGGAPREAQRVAWATRFGERDAGRVPRFLAAWVSAYPDDVAARLDLLILQNRLREPEAISALEAALADPAVAGFGQRYKGDHSSPPLRNVYDLASRLIRLYGRQGRETDAVALAFRILEGQAPFGWKATWPDGLPTPRSNWNDRIHGVVLHDLLHALYAALPMVRTPEDRDRLLELVEPMPCIPLRNQVARLLQGPDAPRLDPASAVRRPVRELAVSTPGLPEGIQLLSNRDDVRSLSADGTWYGTSWGLVRIRYEGDRLDLVQIPTGGRVTSFAETPHGVFAGGFEGLFQIADPDGPAPSLVRIPVDLGAADDWTRRLRPMQLLWTGERLWIRQGGQVAALDLDAETWQAYGQVSGTGMVAGHGTVWCGTHVLDPDEDAFIPLEIDNQQADIIGATPDAVWASVWVDDARRHRPARIDPVTRRVEVLPLTGPSVDPKQPPLVNGPFVLLSPQPSPSRANPLHPVETEGTTTYLLGDDHLLVAVDPSADRLEARVVADLHRELDRAEAEALLGPGHLLSLRRGRGVHGLATALRGDRGPKFVSVQRGDHHLVGAARVHNWREDNFGIDGGGGMHQHIQDLESGLFQVGPDGTDWELLGHPAQSLTDFYVRRIVVDPEDGRAYVLTNGGVTILSLPDAEVAGVLTVSDGLPTNRVEDVVRFGRHLFLACSLGDHDGGLAVLDLDTGLVQVLSTADGLRTDKIRALAVRDGQIDITYGWMYGPRTPYRQAPDIVVADGNFGRTITFPGSRLDPVTLAITPGDSLPPPITELSGPRLPFLGGHQLAEAAFGDFRLLGGTHGLLIVRGEAEAAEPDLPVRTLRTVQRVISRREAQMAEARALPVRGLTPEQVHEHARSDNPFVRAQVLTSIPDQPDNWETYADLLEQAIRDPFLRARPVAAVKVDRLAPDEEAVRLLSPLLEDPDRRLSAFALLATARHGRRPEPERVAGLLDWDRRTPNFVYGAEGAVELQVSSGFVFEAAAPHADAEIFRVLMEHPFRYVNYDKHSRRVYEALGTSLRARPEAADVLLAAFPSERHAAAPDFSRDVFKHAGPELLPVLLEALRSSDRVVRYNAARACGAIGDPTVTDALIQGLDLESGLSRAGIVWALGQIKAEASLPYLASLYSEALTDEAHRAGSGYRFAQAQARIQSEMRVLTSWDDLDSEWNELTAPAREIAHDPASTEPLLAPRDILEAVAAIGGEHAQAFWRQVAGQASLLGRLEAARHLADPGHQQLNLPILRTLSGDSDPNTAAAALASRLMLGDTEAEPGISSRLASSDYSRAFVMHRELRRVPDLARLAFALGELRAFAASPKVQSLFRSEVEGFIHSIEAAVDSARQ